MKQIKHELAKKPKKTSATATPEAAFYKPSTEYKKFPLRAQNGQLTLAGFIKEHWDELCTIRCWKISTAEQYERIVLQDILPAMQEIAPGRALVDLFESHILSLWSTLLYQMSTHQLKKASFLIRLIFDFAYEKGCTKTILWALPLETTEIPPGLSNLTDIDGDTESPAEREAGMRIIEKRKIPKSLPLEVELRLLKILLHIVNRAGESIGVLLMLCTGARPSEVCGLCFKHLQELIPNSGYWLFCRCDIFDSFRRVLYSGKTNNSFRLLVALPFLVSLLLKRKKELAELYPDVDIGNLPIACVGTDYFRPCKPEELNRAAKVYFMQAGLDSNIVLHAYQAILDKNSEACRDCEALISAYLLRRHFITMLIFCNILRIDLKYLMGHALHDPQSFPSDYTNKDLFRRLSDQLRSLPISMVFDDPCTDDPLVLDVMEEVRMIWAKLDAEKDAHTTESESTAQSTSRSSVMSESESTHPTCAPKTSHAAIDAGVLPPSQVAYAFFDAPAYAVTQYCGVQQLLPQYPTRNARIRGSALLPKDYGDIRQVFSAVPCENLYILTPDARLYRLQTKRLLSDPALNGSQDILTQALSDRGIPLQSPLFTDPDGTIVCLSNCGRVRRISTKHIKRFQGHQRQLVELSPGEQIVSACICTDSDPILLATAQGQALHIAAEDLRPVSDTGAQLYPGIHLKAGDTAAVCLPYLPKQEYLIIKRNGLAVRLSGEFSLPSHNRGSQGREIVKVSAGDSVLAMMPTPKAVLLVSHSRYLCLDTKSIRAVSGVSIGTQTMKLPPNSQLISAIGLDTIR